MTKPVEVVTSVERRRRWSRAEKERIIAAMEPGAVASKVARARDPHVGNFCAQSAATVLQWPACNRLRRNQTTVNASLILFRAV